MAYSREKIAIDREWLTHRYVVELTSVRDIAVECSCSEPTIRKWLKIWHITRGKQAIIGKPAWNSGLTKDVDERVAKMAESKLGENNPMYGRDAWNKGLSKDTNSVVAKIAEKLTGASPDAKTREKMAEAKRGVFGERANRWKGGTYKRGASGYDLIRVDGKKLYLHRHVAETLLLRGLKTEEQVHHIDMNRQNNHPTNLLVLHEAAHTELHRAMSKDPSLDQERWLNENGHYYERVL